MAIIVYYVEELLELCLVHLDVELLDEPLDLVEGQRAVLVLVRLHELLLQIPEKVNPIINLIATIG